MRRRLARYSVCVAALLLVDASGCVSPGDRARVARENDDLRVSVSRLESLVARRDAQIARQNTEIDYLKGFGPDRPADLFAPTAIEIASLSGGADYDGVPGDDGVTVYLRPKDGDGDVVKVPGRIKIQLVDNSDLAAPRVLGVYEFSDPAALRRAWHGRFATNHYSLKCPFGEGVSVPVSRKVTVSAEFVDFLTGRTLTAVKEVPLSRPES